MARRIQLHDIAGLRQRIKYGIVLSLLVTMAEKMVFL